MSRMKRNRISRYGAGRIRNSPSQCRLHIPSPRAILRSGTFVSVRTFYRRHLPHYQPPEATYFVTFRLAGSLPGETIERLKQERVRTLQQIAGTKENERRAEEFHNYQISYFEQFDELLDRSTVSPQWLNDDRIAKIVVDTIHHFLAHPHQLLCFCIMPNHVHLICKPCNLVDRVSSVRLVSPYESFPLTRILRRIKGATARQANLILRRQGAFWQHESYDRVIRDGEELEMTLWYVLNNPVKARLVDEWQKWPWTYCNPSIM